MSVLEASTETVWGVWYRRPGGEHITWAGDEATARADAGQRPAAGCRITLVRRKVTYGPVAPVAEGTWHEPLKEERP